MTPQELIDQLEKQSAGSMDIILRKFLKLKIYATKENSSAVRLCKVLDSYGITYFTNNDGIVWLPELSEKLHRYFLSSAK